ARDERAPPAGHQDFGLMEDGARLGRRKILEWLRGENVTVFRQARHGLVAEHEAGLVRRHRKGQPRPHQNRSGTWRALTSMPERASFSSAVSSGIGGGAPSAGSARPGGSAIAAVARRVTPAGILPRSCGTSVRATMRLVLGSALCARPLRATHEPRSAM